MTDGLDRRLLAELLAQSADAHLDDVRAGIEVVAPHLGQQSLPADDRPGVLDEMVQEPELAIGEVCDERAQPCLSPCEVEGQRACAHDVLVALRRMPPHLDPHPGD
jgi:hypothetical protein